MASHLRLAPALIDNAGSSAPSPIRVVLADDHALMRRSLRAVLDREEDVQVVGEADDLESVEREARARRPHVLVLDLGMRTGSSGIEVIGALRERAPETMIVGLTMKDDPAFAHYALMAGAVGFISKDLADDELTPAVRAAAHGEQFVSPRVAARLDARRHTSALGRRYDAASRESGNSA
jgi:two-component system, NarL family, response regulator NreC